MTISIKILKRDQYGKNVARRLRRENMLPAILYGRSTDALPLTMDKKDLFNILKSESGENTIFKITFDSESWDVMIKSLQKDPVTEEILHADLIQIEMDRAVKVSIPVVLTGEAVGVKAEGGFVDFVTREVEIECLPKDIPENIEVDISDLHLHQSLKIEDLTVPQGVTLDGDPQTMIVLIQAPTIEEEVVEEEEVLEEGEEAAEAPGEEAAEEEKKEEKKEE